MGAREEDRGSQEKREQLVEKAQKQIEQEIFEVNRKMVDQCKQAKAKRDLEVDKYPKWYEAAEKLDKILSSGSTSTSQ